MKKKLTNDRPIFLQIKEIIEEDILTGNLKANERIPSTNELVDFYSINPVTVLKGINLLTEDGIIYKKRGIGMFVSEDALAILRGKYDKSFSDSYVDPMVRKAKQLEIDKDSLVKMIDKSWERGK